jgi:hypothetical protein
MGSRLAETITEDDVQRWVETVMPKLSPKSVVDRHSLLHGIYGWAVKGRHPKPHTTPASRPTCPSEA